LKTKNLFDLDPERLATTDEHGNRIYLYPEDVKGIWKNRRKKFYWFLIILYLVLPWIYINGKPFLMINIFEREFTFMGFTLHGVEPLLFFTLFASGLFFVAFMTSLFGRVWCGWACPQTVFIQSLFLKIEAMVEGKARERRELDFAPWNVKKIFKRSLKWVLYFIVSLHIAHTFVGYFVGPRELFLISLHSPSENWGLFTATMIATMIILLDFGWFREQFCIVACPYGRIQSVMMDANSLVVSYDAKRGEPRRGAEGVDRGKEGDCINCYNCVKVCPTGIDIRRGTQLECIACTQCIDACDDIMTKLKKPKGLIRYSSEVEISGGQRRKLTKRSLVYLLFAALFVGLFFVFLNASQKLNLVFLRDKTPFQMIENDQLVLNHFTLKISHQGSDSFKIDFKFKNPELQNKAQIITPVRPVKINVPEKKIVLFFKFPKEVLSQGTRRELIEVINLENQEILLTKEVVLVGPVD
jgi:cytochrome c oxidase accessory protein FixG